MNSKLRAAYDKARRDLCMPANHALAYARHITKRLRFDVPLGDEWASFPYRDAAGRFAGFDMRARLVIDESGDTSWLGEYTDSPDGGAIKRHDCGRNQFAYIKPAITAAQHFKELHGRCKLGRTEARKLAAEYVARDIARLEQWGSGERPLFGVVVECSRAGVKLGSASLWGIDDDDSLTYCRRDVLGELADEAADEARASLGRLCECAA